MSAEINQGTLRFAEVQGVELLHSCGGLEACTGCRVVVRQGIQKYPSSKEAVAVLAESGILRSHRIACQARIFGGVTFESLCAKRHRMCLSMECEW